MGARASRHAGRRQAIAPVALATAPDHSLGLFVRIGQVVGARGEIHHGWMGLAPANRRDARHGVEAICDIWA